MTNIVALFMLLAPGLIAVRVLWKGRDIGRKQLFSAVSDYVIFSFLIQMMTYGVMWFSFTDRTVSFSMNISAISHISSAGFVFKYSSVSFALAIVLPVVVSSALIKWQNMEDKLWEQTEEMEPEADEDSR